MSRTGAFDASERDGCELCRGGSVVEVVEVSPDGASAIVRGEPGAVALDLVADVRPGDRLLVEGGFALARLE